MKCEEVMELVQRSLDEDLSSQEHASMMEHIRQCPECAAMFDRLTRLSQNLAELPRVEPRYSLVDAILPQLEQIDAESAGVLAAGPTGTDGDSGSSGAADAASFPAAELSRTEADGPAKRPARSWMRRFGAAATAAAAAVIAAVMAIHPSPWLSNTAKKDQASEAGGNAVMNLSAASADSAPAASPSSAGANADEALPKNPSENPAPSPGPAMAEDRGSGKDETYEETRSIGKSGDGEAKTGASRLEDKAAGTGQAPAGSGNKTFEKGGQAPAEDAAQAPAAAAGETPEEDGAKALDATSPPSLTPPSPGAEPPHEALALPSASPSADGPASLAFGSVSSPDGTRYAFAEGGRLKVCDADGKLLFESEERPGTLSRLQWSEDGKTVYYAWTAEDGTESVYSWSLESGERKGG
ncbi:anti-sigma factor family protein [Cohnella laeviribosi]|uniref:anti-sigma factor family protein n=1 Tax=Cohnella laeviribosi TaxID=380174 RepID=UPI00036850DE|nr:zf-HC2 domain-containing protein [Cohnella laeviribosi]